MSSFDEEKNKPIEGFDIAYSDEELQIAKQLHEGAKRLNEAINNALHGKLINSKKEQEKMKKYEINLQEVAEDLNSYLDGTETSWDYDVYTHVSKMGNSIWVTTKGMKIDVVILKWRADDGLDWENRWEVQTVDAKYYSSQGEMTLYKLALLLNTLDDFINHWYGQNQEPEPDMKRNLPQAIINKLKIAFNDNRNEIDAHYYDNSLFVSIINPNNLATIEANYLIKDRSAFLTSCHTGGAFLTKEADVSTIVRKCVMEWDK